MADQPNSVEDEELRREVERLRREKAEAEAQKIAAEAKAAAEAESAETAKREAEAKIKAELEAQKIAAAEKEARDKEKKLVSKSRRRKIIGGIIVVILLAFVVLIASSSVSVGPSSGAASYPYTTTYSVWFPLGQPVSFNNNELIALSMDNEMLISINGQTSKLVAGVPIAIGEQSATLTTLFGKVPVTTINYKVTLEYQGNTAENQAYFKMLIQTDKSIPEFVVKFLLPKNVIAQAA